MIREALKGLGVVAYGDPPPSAGGGGSMSYVPGTNRGAIRLVGSLGKARTATYIAIYRTNPWVYAAVNAISRSIARLPGHVYMLDANGDKERQRFDVPQTPGRPSAGVTLDRLLNVNDDGISRIGWYGATLRDRLIHGNALWEILGAGSPTGLRRIPWKNVEHVEEDDYGRPQWYEICDRGTFTTRRKLLPNDVIHFGLGSEPDQACGVSILESCHATIALYEAVMRHLSAYLENSARGTGYFQVENEKQAEQARKLITELYTSPENAGKVLVTSGQWKGMADSPEHSGVLDLVRESRVEVAAAFGVPPTELGLLENAIRANVKEMREKMGRDTIGPWSADFESEVQAQLMPRSPGWSNMFFEFQLAEMLRPDLEARALVYQRLAFVLTIDDIRRMENLPPLKIEGVTDVPWAASGMLPLTTAAKQTRSRNAQAAPANAADAVQLVLALGERNGNGNGHHELSEVS